MLQFFLYLNIFLRDVQFTRLKITLLESECEKKNKQIKKTMMHVICTNLTNFRIIKLNIYQGVPLSTLWGAAAHPDPAFYACDCP